MSDTPLSELLDTLLKKLNIDPDSGMASMKKKWVEIVGHDLAFHTSAYEIHGHTLTILCDHPAYSSLVLMRRRQIERNLARIYPELDITVISVRVRK